MPKIQIDNIIVKSSTAPMSSPIVLDITFTALKPLPQPLLWKVIYVGSAFSEEHDQILEQVQIERVQEASTLNFELQCPAPNYNTIPREQLICTTAFILCGSYLGQEFIRVGYYVHNAYLGEQEPNGLEVQQIVDRAERTIIVEKPRITKFQINWGDQQSETQRMLREDEGRESAEEGKVPADFNGSAIPKSGVMNQVTEGQEKAQQEVPILINPSSKQQQRSRRESRE